MKKNYECNKNKYKFTNDKPYDKKCRMKLVWKNDRKSVFSKTNDESEMKQSQAHAHALTACMLVNAWKRPKLAWTTDWTNCYAICSIFINN